MMRQLCVLLFSICALTTHASPTDDPMPVNYGEASSAVTQATEPPSASTTDPYTVPSLNKPADYVDYDYAARSSSAWLVPLTAYDDNRSTYIRFQKNASIPAIFGRVTERGDDYLVNNIVMEDTSVVKIQGVHAYLVLRYGEHVVGLRRRSAR